MVHSILQKPGFLVVLFFYFDKKKLKQAKLEQEIQAKQTRDADWNTASQYKRTALNPVWHYHFTEPTNFVNQQRNDFKQKMCKTTISIVLLIATGIILSANFESVHAKKRGDIIIFGGGGGGGGMPNLISTGNKKGGDIIMLGRRRRSVSAQEQQAAAAPENNQDNYKVYRLVEVTGDN